MSLVSWRPFVDGTWLGTRSCLPAALRAGLGVSQLQGSRSAVPSLQGAAAVQQPAVGEAPARCQGLPELGHTGAGLAGRVCCFPWGLATSGPVLLCIQT